jgi:hypothetical protein
MKDRDPAFFSFGERLVVDVSVADEDVVHERRCMALRIDPASRRASFESGFMWRDCSEASQSCKGARNRGTVGDASLPRHRVFRHRSQVEGRGDAG